MARDDNDIWEMVYATPVYCAAVALSEQLKEIPGNTGIVIIRSQVRLAKYNLGFCLYDIFAAEPGKPSESITEPDLPAYAVHTEDNCLICTPLK